jgi:hypothetical protein
MLRILKILAMLVAGIALGLAATWRDPPARW